MGLDLDPDNANTHLSVEEREGLKVPAIFTKGQLDEHEQANIELAIEWLITKSYTPDKLLSEKHIKELHKRMYNRVWKWAGQFRTSNKNLGIEWFNIPVALRQLLDDTSFWISNKTYSPEEIAIRFKHQLVSIHCFPNGNGRHSRLMADLIIEKIFRLENFTWGAAHLSKESDQRSTYIAALRSADKGNVNPLIAFARS